MNCPKCQFVLPDDKAAACPFCQAPLGGGAAAPPPLPGLPPIPFGGVPTPAPRPIMPPPPAPAPMVPPPMVAPPVPQAAPPGIPGLAPPGFPGIMPPTPGAVNSDPLNLEGLHRQPPPAAAPPPALDPMDPLAFPMPGASPAPHAAPAPQPEVRPSKPGEIEWEAPPPPSKGGGKNFAYFIVLAILGAGYQMGFLNMDWFYNMLSKGSAQQEKLPPLTPPGQTPGGFQPGSHVDWKQNQQPTTAPTAAPTPTPSVEEPETPALPKERWTFEGKIYDMLTLRPVFAAEVRLQAGKEDRPLSVQTDEHGRYRIEVPALEQGAYQLTVVHPDYDSKKYFDEISPPYRTLEADERKALVRLVPRHKAWTGKVGGKTRRDLVLLPAQHHIQAKDDVPSLDNGLDTQGTDSQ